MSVSIAVITYEHPHRKTQDLLFRLKALGYSDITLLALPFVARAKLFTPIYQHRPSHCVDVLPRDLAARMGMGHVPVESNNLEHVLTDLQPMCTLIAGAGLLPKSLVESHKIINSHPAYLPLVRGLDALKWAIHHRKAAGVTTHFVAEQADAGWLIEQRKVGIASSDTFHSFAQRLYDTEIDMLANSISIVQERSEFPALPVQGEVHRRMPKAIEQNLLADFERYRLEFSTEGANAPVKIA